jgi:hypothetical protein
MAITMKDVRRWLDPEEPDYEGARQALGSEAIPLLLLLIEGSDLGLASKATYLASLIPGPESVALLRAAQARNQPVLRVAAASAIRNLSQSDGEQLFELLHADPDPGVRKVTLNSGIGLTSPKVRAHYQAAAASDADPAIRALAAKAAATMQTK